MKRLPTRHGALLIAVGGHATLLWPLLATPEVAPRLISAPVMTVSLVSPAAEPAVPPVVPPPPPRPQVKPLPRPATDPLPVARTPEPAPQAPAPPTPAAPAAAAPPLAPPVAAAPPTPPAEAPVIEARFDAAYLNNPRPAYPPLARRLGEQGQVLLRAYVSADGRPEQIELRRSSGSARLDAAAHETVRRWRFVPARRGDAPIAAWVLIPINFRLDS